MEKFDFMSLEEEPSVEDTPKQEDVVEDQDLDVEVEDVEEDEPVVKTQYTPEEIQEILSSDGEVDIDRLSPAEQATMKAMQRAFTPKLQEAAELRKEMADIRRQMEEAKPKQQPQDIFEAYDQDPDGVLEYVNGEISKLSENPQENLLAIEQLRDLKLAFNRRDIQRFQDASKSKNQARQHVQKMMEHIPDLPSKQASLREFALNELGYTPEELAYETDPTKVGENAVRAVMRINAAYDKFNARKTVKEKKAPKVPTKVEKPANNDGTRIQPDDLEELNELKKKGIKTGNFKDYFAALSEED